MLAVMTTIAACALTSGVYRTAVTLKNGTQEIFPDSIVQRFTYTHVTQAGKTRHLLNVIKNGEVDMTIDTDSIVELDYGEMSSYEHFAGEWWLVMSPNGEPNEQGIMVTEAVSAKVHAVLPAPGSPDYGSLIYCHIDSMPHRMGLRYSADFVLRYAHDDALQRGTITMVLDDQQPITSQQYAGDASTYAYFNDETTWYMGVSPQHEGGDTGNRYIYFVGQDIDTQRLQGMEITAAWSDADQLDLEHEYSFPRQYQIYWITALDIPYSYVEHDEVGMIDIFSSPRLMRHPWTKPLKEE